MNMHLFYNRTFLFVMLDVFSDFDFALKVEGGTPSVRHEGWGNPGYWAPEIHSMQAYDPFATHIWSL